MKTIRDPIHGDIELSELELALIDSEPMQRLRRIKQLSFCSLVYPGANHSRFEHSLGTMHLAGRMARKLSLDEELIRLAALLHDVGHLPYSHSLEDVFEISHEDNMEFVLKDQLGDLLSDHGYSVSDIVSVCRESQESSIISSQIDSDRMDYLLRDSHYTGVAYGAIDSDRIINVMGFVDGMLTFRKKGLIAVEGLLIGRHQMYEAVYFHHTVRAADAMLQKAISHVKEGLNTTELLRMGDSDLKEYAKQESEVAKNIFDMLDRRQLYKTIYLKDCVDTTEIRERIDAKEHEIIQSSVSLGRDAFDIMIDDSGIVKKITDVSQIAQGFERGLPILETTILCVAPQLKESVSRIVKK